MDKKLAPLLFVFSICCRSFAQDGHWEGEITHQNKIWKVVLDFTNSNGGQEAFVDFVDVGGYHRLFSVAKYDSTFHLERAQPNGKKITFDGTIHGEIFSGVWSGIGIERAAFRLNRVKKKRPPIVQEDVTFVNKEAILSGTLLLPGNTGKFPVVIFMHGGAAENRWIYYGAALKFLDKGIAALIYDKRGVERSRGGDWQQDGLTALADDAIAAVNLLKKRKDIDPKRIAVFGHSEGGWTAPLATSRSKDITYLVVSGASSVSASEQTIYHRRNIMAKDGFDTATIERCERLWRQLYTATRLCSSDTAKARKLKKISNDSIEAVHQEPWFASAALPYPYSIGCPTSGVMELLFLNPIAVWKKIKVPVLAVWGEKDIVVPVQKSKRDIEKALLQSGNNQATFIIIPQADHGFLLESADSKEWDFPRMDGGYYEGIARWLAQKMCPKKTA